MLQIFNPYGAWKIEPSRTYGVNENGKQVFIEYAKPACVPVLMEELLAIVNTLTKQDLSLENPPMAYAKIHMGFVHMHPFWDGNGRMGRLLSNIPLLKSGLPPIVISKESRREYIDVLSKYQRTFGELTVDSGAWPGENLLEPFAVFCEKQYVNTINLVAEVKALQQKRQG